MTRVCDPAVVEELTALHAAYERALMANDIPALSSFFWDSEWAVRFGATESLYGAAQIAAFRHARPTRDLARTITALQVVTFDGDTGITTLEFVREIGGEPHVGRQTQIWRRFERGWKIVSAHVSLLAETRWIDHAARLVHLPLPPALRSGVEVQFTRARIIADAILDFPLDDTIEIAPVFQP
jgi:ketosteroid isomerase-like protein